MLLGVTLVLGFGYPLVVTGLSALMFGHQANGSLVYRGRQARRIVAARPEFADSKGNPLPGYFQPRPSAAGTGYDAAASAPPIWAPRTRCSSDSYRE